MLHGILAAVFGTVLMTLSSQTEMILSGREASNTPGMALSRLIQLAGGPELKGKALAIASYWMHWIYGSLWGLVFGWLAGSTDIALPVVGILYWALVWGAAQIHQPLLGVAKPIWQYGTKAAVTDGFHHLVYACGTTLGWALITLSR